MVDPCEGNASTGSDETFCEGHTANRRTLDRRVFFDPPRCAPSKLPARVALSNSSGSPLFERLLAAENFSARSQVVSNALEALGLAGLGYCTVSCVGRRLCNTSACGAHMDTEWLQRYLEQGYSMADPRMAHAVSSALPCVWETDCLEREPSQNTPSAERQRLVRDLRASGTRSGITFSVAGGRPLESYVITLSSRSPSVDHLHSVAGEALMLGLAVHEFYSRYAALPETGADAGVPLTPLQRRIMHCLARGYADKEMAAELQITLANVDYHLRRLRKRFRVHNRTQLLQAMQAEFPLD